MSVHTVLRVTEIGELEEVRKSHVPSQRFGESSAVVASVRAVRKCSSAVRVLGDKDNALRYWSSPRFQKV